MKAATFQKPIKAGIELINDAEDIKKLSEF